MNEEQPTNDRAEQPEQPEVIESVPGAAAPEASSVTPIPAEGSETTYHGGYTGQRTSPDGTNPNAPVINDPAKLGMLDAAAKQVHDKPETPGS